jgi:hypothetical protein
MLTFVLETSPSFREPSHIALNQSMTRKEREEKTVPHHSLIVLEFLTNLFFFIEFLLKSLTAPNKKTFFSNGFNLVDLVAVLPIFFPPKTHPNDYKDGVVSLLYIIRMHKYIRLFYIFRIFRIFSFANKYSGLRVLLLTIRTSIQEFFIYFMLLFMAVITFACLIFYSEQIFERSENKFDSISIGLWWAIVTMTTLGYGDYVPVTGFGYLVGALCAISGLVFLSLPIPLIVNNFSVLYQHSVALANKIKLKEEEEIEKMELLTTLSRSIDSDFQYKKMLTNITDEYATITERLIAKKKKIANNNDKSLYLTYKSRI